MYCRKCGTGISGRVRFCRKCGVVVARKEEEPVTQPVGLGTDITSGSFSFGGAIISKIRNIATAINGLRKPRIAGGVLVNLKKRRLRILAVIVLVTLILAGLGVNTVMARQAEIEEFDSRLTKIRTEADKLLNDVKELKEKLEATRQAVGQAQQSSVELESALDAHDEKLEEHNRKVEELNSRPHTLSDGSLVDRLNSLGREYNTLLDEYKARLSEFRNLHHAALPLKNEITALTEEMNALEIELNAKVDLYERLIKAVNLKRRSISLYSLNFNDNLESLVRKSRSIDASSVLEGMEKLRSQIDLVNSKLDELNQNIEKRGALHQSLLTNEERREQILDTMLRIAPR